MFSKWLEDTVMDIANSYHPDSNSEEAKYQSTRKGCVMIAGVVGSACAGPAGAVALSVTTGAFMDAAATTQTGKPVGLLKAVNDVATNAEAPLDMYLSIMSDVATGLSAAGESFPSFAVKCAELARQAKK